MKIGFIGLGVMGKSMARNLLRAGYSLIVYTRTKEKAEELLREGAVWKENVSALAKEADVVITMVGYPNDVEEVYFGENGLIENVRAGTYIIDMTTSPPSLAEKIYDAAKKRGVFALDAPVSGGDIGAKEGTLTIMVGGDEKAFQACQPIFAVLGKNIVFQGKAGAGQHTKMCNQIAIATNMIGVCEALAYAKRSGLDPLKVLESISQGAAGSWSLSNLAPRMIAGNFAPGFYVKHFIKDMKIALAEAEKMNLKLPGLALAKEMYEQLAAAGEENSGTQALYKRYVNE
ncbi:NAD(P)-dependent oxidoreductase [Anoxybacteroides amylolyticum]|uniref:NAD-binding of NADP-dependent 3-hydroxyisobutyrate dehydrogenase family protein n=1 Tax=Anoxybacteroides amylolyticum TaxID=294699 RepID=A0A160F4C6_9BACL|nr:NAD(P)-dependent oxidoreductase [Anoxybacillus amylolyticus]ANB61277.1 NAD-binding of NADP-dependent 3-hydroxyisobutyrate dehydrogenase family protein [Anoxybacillus amylolyticus]